MSSLYTELKAKLASAEKKEAELLQSNVKVEEEMRVLTERLASLKQQKEFLSIEHTDLSRSMKDMRHCLQSLGSWKNRVVAGEPVLLTVHNSGELDGHVESKPRYKIVFRNGVFEGFQDPTTNEIFTSPSGLCCAKLSRSGPKKTNQWQGPAHCLVLRKGNWTPLNKL
jgi:hypothetical protein